MAITREAKEQQLSDLENKLTESQLTVICDYRGITVANIQDLRNILKANGSSFKVIKKTLIQKAFVSAGIKDKSGELAMDGQLGLAFGFEDEVTVAQLLAKFAKDNPELEIKAGINSEGVVLSAEKVKHLATLPSKDQLRGQLVGTLIAPITGFARVLEGNISGLVRALNQLREQKA